MSDQPPQPDPTPLSRGEYFLDQARREWRYRVFLIVAVGVNQGLDSIDIPGEATAAAGLALLAWCGKAALGRFM